MCASARVFIFIVFFYLKNRKTSFLFRIFALYFDLGLHLGLHIRVTFFKSLGLHLGLHF